MIDPQEIDTLQVQDEVWRIIPSRYPQISLFERVSSFDEFDLLHEIESLTNRRLRDEVGDVSRVAPEDFVGGNGASWIMAPFTHPPQEGQGGRFNKDFGIYYCAFDESVAIAETLYHRQKFFDDSGVLNEIADMRVLRASVAQSFHDVRPFEGSEIYHPDDYQYGQQLGGQLKAQKSYGLLYKSVRATGDCIAILRPIALSSARHIKYLRYHFVEGAPPLVEELKGNAA